jgi:hypothetical protein
MELKVGLTDLSFAIITTTIFKGWACYPFLSQTWHIFEDYE